MEEKTNISAQELDELYAAWGTTREEHLAKMKKLIARKSAEAHKRLAEAEAAKQLAEIVELAEPAEKRAAAKPKETVIKLVLTKDEVASIEDQVAQFLKERVAKSIAHKEKPARGRLKRHHLFGKPSREYATKERQEIAAEQYKNLVALLKEQRPEMFSSKLVAKRHTRGETMMKFNPKNQEATAIVDINTKTLEGLIAAQIIPDGVADRIIASHGGLKLGRSKAAKGPRYAQKPRSSKGRRKR